MSKANARETSPPPRCQVLASAVDEYNASRSTIHKEQASIPCDTRTPPVSAPGGVRERLEYLSKRSLQGDVRARRELIDLGFQELERIGKKQRLQKLCDRARVLMHGLELIRSPTNEHR